ncbi:hypothetical protein BDN72DRAFT_904017 [Pluteus cervinus]|uniref:Uncharacterized protein n=1 Tax=Pluteus cervinus TaxID=181527 RepID=A0ACD3A7B0_9AGAR|nr:hypothetical protein BDN72DRAFT_904017 [Pluteus cervinus]
MSVFIRMSHTRAGAERLFDSRLIPTPARCDFLDARPEAHQSSLVTPALPPLDGMIATLGGKHKSYTKSEVLSRIWLWRHSSRHPDTGNEESWTTMFANIVPITDAEVENRANVASGNAVEALDDLCGEFGETLKQIVNLSIELPSKEHNDVENVREFPRISITKQEVGPYSFWSHFTGSLHKNQQRRGGPRRAKDRSRRTNSSNLSQAIKVSALDFGSKSGYNIQNPLAIERVEPVCPSSSTQLSDGILRLKLLCTHPQTFDSTTRYLRTREDFFTRQLSAVSFLVPEAYVPLHYTDGSRTTTVPLLGAFLRLHSCVFDLAALELHTLAKKGHLKAVTALLDALFGIPGFTMAMAHFNLPWKLTILS